MSQFKRHGSGSHSSVSTYVSVPFSLKELWCAGSPTATISLTFLYTRTAGPIKGPDLSGIVAMAINHDRSRISRLTTPPSFSSRVLGISEGWKIKPEKKAEKKNEAIRVELGLRDFFRGRIDFSLRKRSTDPSMAGALQYLESQQNAQPELADWYGALADLYQRKLWHQLTIKLEQFVALAVFRVDFFSISSALPRLLLGFKVISLTIGLVFCLVCPGYWIFTGICAFPSFLSFLF